MKKVLITYFSSTGKTKQMAEYIAEGIRFNGHTAAVKNIDDIKGPADLDGYDGYIFGSPTFSIDLPKPVKNFLSLTQKARLGGKLGGAFGPYLHDVGYKHDAYAATIILDSLEKENKMKPFELGPFNLQENIVETTEGMKACQEYGKLFGEDLV
ncbi:MAG: flavodoxin domain-containing protein [Dehalococcoidales bacterium]|nr:flavodoxin domain-containing protein [Dehalococcoidales bacterium]